MPNSFIGDKIKISRIINKEIAVHGYKITDSKFEGKGKCLHLQIKLNGNMHVVFTGSVILMDTIQQIAKEHFPFTTTIIEENDSYQFS